jgi:hypothetical protein
MRETRKTAGRIKNCYPKKRVGGMDYFFGSLTANVPPMVFRSIGFSPNQSDHGEYAALLFLQRVRIGENYFLVSVKNKKEYTHIVTHLPNSCNLFYKIKLEAKLLS